MLVIIIFCLIKHKIMVEFLLLIRLIKKKIDFLYVKSRIKDEYMFSWAEFMVKIVLRKSNLLYFF